MKFSAYLRTLRKREGLTQEDLARALGVSNAYIHQLETGKIDAPTEERCRQLAQVLGVMGDEIWEVARRERLIRFVRREGIDPDEVTGEASEGDESEDASGLTAQERSLIELIRRMDAQTRRHFNDTVFMLLRFVEDVEIREHLRNYLGETGT